jgi:saccharopine dehydrogenase-like NADP-dependent oxidoreductase
MKKQIVVLGAGMVGRVMAIDLAKKYNVKSVDANEKNLALLRPHGIETEVTNLHDEKKIKSVIKKADVVVGAVPGFMGFNMVKAVINAGKSIADISFFPEDAFRLNQLAKEKNVTAAIDCGVAPGMDNIILGYHAARMKVHEFVCYVGGLPFTRTLPYQYKAPFSPIDVIEEYTRPARFIKDGKEIVMPALTEPELVEMEPIGTLEAFNSDGLRTLLRMKVPNMKEKTLRYPGHREFMEQLRDGGFFSEDEIVVNGNPVRPIDVTSAVMLPRWKYEKAENEFTIMRIIVKGIEKKKSVSYQYDLFDTFDFSTNSSSMARTTGFVCTAVATLIAEGMYPQKGIIAPEFLGKEKKCFDFILNYLKERNVNYKFSEK